MPYSKTQSSPFYSKLAAVLISLIALFYIAIQGKSIIAPLIFGLIFAVMLVPLAGFLEHKLRFSRSIASALALILLVLFIAGLLYLIGSQVSAMSEDWPQFKEQVLNSLNDLQHWISTKFHVRVKQQNNYLGDAASRILTTGPAVIGNAVMSVSSTIIFIVFALIDTFFLLYYRRLIIRFLVAVFREENTVTVYDILAHIQSSIRNYILGLLLEMLIVSGAACLVLWLLGVKYAMLLGLITGLFNIVPYIGFLTALLLSTLVTFATAAASAKILLVAASLVGIHILDANILLPVIVGSKVRINALITILGVIVGGSVWGISGMFLAIPIIAMAKIVFDRVDSLKPWGMLLGDVKDGLHEEPLKEKIIEEGPLNNLNPDAPEEGKEGAG